jgi:hypothetical protein
MTKYIGLIQRYGTGPRGRMFLLIFEPSANEDDIRGRTIGFLKAVFAVNRGPYNDFASLFELPKAALDRYVTLIDWESQCSSDDAKFLEGVAKQTMHVWKGTPQFDRSVPQDFRREAVELLTREPTPRANNPRAPSSANVKLSPHDKTVVARCVRRMAEEEAATGDVQDPELVVLSSGYAEVWPDGSVVQNGRQLNPKKKSVVDDPSLRELNAENLARVHTVRLWADDKIPGISTPLWLSGFEQVHVPGEAVAKNRRVSFKIQNDRDLRIVVAAMNAGMPLFDFDDNFATEGRTASTRAALQRADFKALQEIGIRTRQRARDEFEARMERRFPNPGIRGFKGEPSRYERQPVFEIRHISNDHIGPVASHSAELKYGYHSAYGYPHGQVHGGRTNRKWWGHVGNLQFTEQGIEGEDWISVSGLNSATELYEALVEAMRNEPKVPRELLNAMIAAKGI